MIDLEDGLALVGGEVDPVSREGVGERVAVDLVERLVGLEVVRDERVLHRPLAPGPGDGVRILDLRVVRQCGDGRIDVDERAVGVERDRRDAVGIECHTFVIARRLKNLGRSVHHRDGETVR